MRSIKLVLIAVGAVLALSAFSVSGASALPLFVSKSGKYPVHGSISGGAAKLVTTSGHTVSCDSTDGLSSFGLVLGLILIVFHKCTTSILFSQKAPCTSTGEPTGLIHVHIHFLIGYLKTGAGEKMVGLLAKAFNGSNTDAVFVCEEGAEKENVTVLGEVVGEVAAAETNKMQKTFKVEFKQSAGKQSAQTFVLPTGTEMTAVHLTSDLSGFLTEKPESSEEATGTATLDGTEEGEIKA